MEWGGANKEGRSGGSRVVCLFYNLKMIPVSDGPPKHGALRLAVSVQGVKKGKELFEKFLSEMLPVSPEGADADPSLSSCKVLLAMKENFMVGSIPPFFSLLFLFLHLTSFSVFFFFLRGFHSSKGNILKGGGGAESSLPNNTADRDTRRRSNYS